MSFIQLIKTIWQRVLVMTIALITVLLVVSCGDPELTPTVVPDSRPEILGFRPNQPVVQTHQEIKIEVEVDKNDHDVSYEWSVKQQDGGIIDNSGDNIVTYQAPEKQGTYQIEIQLKYDQGSKSVGDTVSVKVVEGTTVIPTPTATPMPTLTPTPMSTATPTATKVLSQPEAPRETPIPIPTKQSKVHEKLLGENCSFKAVVFQDYEPFSYIDENNNRVGFDIDLIREFAGRWCENPDGVEFIEFAELIPVRAACRIPALDGNQMPEEKDECNEEGEEEIKGQGDIIAAALTKTQERCQYVECSPVYFQDGQKLLVHETSSITDVCDLRDKKIALAQGSTSIANLKRAARECQIVFEPDIEEFTDTQKIIDLVITKKYDAYATDEIALHQFAEGKPLKVVGSGFSEELYVLGLPKDDEYFLQLVELTLLKMEEDGTFADIYCKWFGGTRGALDMRIGHPKGDLILEALAISIKGTRIPRCLTPPECPNPYEVQEGENLDGIAKKCVGYSWPAWKLIYDENRSLIGPDPNTLEVGLELTIPPELLTD